MKEIPLSQGLIALVDDADYDRVVAAGRWHAASKGRTFYAQRNERLPDGRFRVLPLHKFLTGWLLVDHIDGNGLNNVRSNLRPATARQNQGNARIRTDNTSGFKGVSWNARDRRWQASIRIPGSRRRSLGYFITPEEAARAYDAAARELFGEFARPNFPEAH